MIKPLARLCRILCSVYSGTKFIR